MILDSINRQLSTITDILSTTKAEMRKKECVDSHWKISKNSEDKIHKIFKEFLNAKGGHGTMKWQVWEQTTIVVNVRKKKKFVKEERRRRMLISKSG